MYYYYIFFYFVIIFNVTFNYYYYTFIQDSILQKIVKLNEYQTIHFKHLPVV